MTMSSDPFAFRRMLPGAAKESLLRMNFLYQAAYHLHALYPDNAGMTRHLIYQLKHIGRRQVLRIHSTIKRGCCKYCHSLMTPGLTTKVRYKRRLDKVVTITCDECGRARTYNNRRSYRKRNQASKESDSEPEAMDIDEPTSPVSDMEFELPEPVHPSVPELEPLELKDLLYKILFVFPSEKTEEKWSKLEEKWPKLAKLWNNVVADPLDFEAWMEVLDLIDRKDKLSYARVAYDEFFRLYPYCYGYWTKYADIEIRHHKYDKAKEVFESAVKAIPLSSYVWLAYIQFTKSHGEAENMEESLRSLYERALAAAGQDYKADELWVSYIAWEKENGQLKKVTEIYDRLIRLPLENWQKHFTDFKEFVDENQPIEMFPLDAYLRIRAAVTDCPKFDALETQQIRKQIIKNRLKQHWSTEKDFTKRAVYESAIKRPYFHVAPIKLKQLYNWDAYLDQEIHLSGEHKVKLLFERCMIVCALYEDFWLKYVNWTERRGDIEGARNIFRRSTVHLHKKPRVHLAWAAFEERNGNAELAWEILKNIDYQLPGMVEIVMARVSLARRRGTHQVAVRLFVDSIEQTEDVTAKQYYVIKYSRYLDKIMKENNRAVTVLEEAMKTDPMNLRLITALIDLTSNSDRPDDQLVISLYDRVAGCSHVSQSVRQVACRRRFEYSENDAGSADWLSHAHYKQYFMTRNLAREVHDRRMAEIKQREEERLAEEARIERERQEAEVELARKISDDADDEEEVGEGVVHLDENVTENAVTSERDELDSRRESVTSVVSMTSSRPMTSLRVVMNQGEKRNESVRLPGRRDSTDSGSRLDLPRRPSIPRSPSITTTTTTNHTQERGHLGANNRKEKIKDGAEKLVEKSRETTKENKELEVGKKHEEFKLRSVELIQRRNPVDPVVMEDGEVDDVEPPPQIKDERRHSVRSEPPLPFLPSLPDMPPISSNPPLPLGAPSSLPTRPVRPRASTVPTMAIVPGIPVPVMPLVPILATRGRSSSDTEEGEVNQLLNPRPTFVMPKFMHDADLPPSCSLRIKPLFPSATHNRPPVAGNPQFRAGPGPSHLPPQPTVPLSKPKKAKKEKKKKDKKEKKREKNRPSTPGLVDVSDEEEGEIR